MVAKNVRVEFVHGPYDGCHGNFKDVLLRSTIAMPTRSFGIELDQPNGASLAIYKLGDCQTISAPRFSTTVLRYHHAGFTPAPSALHSAAIAREPRRMSRIKRLFARMRSAVQVWMLTPVNYPLQLASRD